MVNYTLAVNRVKTCTAQHSTAQHNIIPKNRLFVDCISWVFFACFSAPQAALSYACILIFALIPHTARAALDCTVKSAQLGYGHANTYLVPPGALAIGDFVGTDNVFEIIYRCKVSGTPTQWGIAEREVASVSSSGHSANWNVTDTAPILTTTQLQQYGLGFSGHYYHRNQWPPAETFINAERPVYFWKDLPAVDGDGYVELGVTVNYRFSKINDNLDAISNGIPVTVQNLPFALAAFAIRDNESGAFSPTAQVTATMPTLTIAQRACTPFTNTVKLPTVNESDLNAINVGDSLPPTDFWIEMRCPSNLAHIGYYVTPVYGFENEAQGVIKINPASNAKGIGLQITTRSIPHPVYIDDSAGIGATYQPIKFGPTNRYRVYSSLRWGAGVNTDPLEHFLFNQLQ